MKLSENFSLEEFLKSDTAARMGRRIDATPEVVEELRYLCQYVLQPVRDGLRLVYGRDIIIRVSSGYRPRWLNTAIGGSETSDHMDGRAADIEAIDLSPRVLATFIRDRIQHYPIKQVIMEFDEWVHVSIPPSPRTSCKREVLTAKKILGKTTYLKGIV